MLHINTKKLLIGGMMAGPLFTFSWLVAGAVRGTGYNPLRHPISSLSIGNMGWSQIITFLIVGTLLLGFAIALGRIAKAQGVSFWGARIIAICAIGLIGAGLLQPTHSAVTRMVCILLVETEVFRGSYMMPFLHFYLLGIRLPLINSLEFL
jgi:hypothetical protein